MAQDPDELTSDPGDVDASHNLDLITLYDSTTVDAEIESDIIRGILDANGIPSVLCTSPYPPLGFQVKVPRAFLADAERVIAEAQAAGPAAAEEAEAATEGGK